MKTKSKNKIALITGSSRGIGKSVALEFAEAGYQVIILGLSNEELLETASEMSKIGEKPVTIKADISDPKEIHRKLSSIKNVDVLINAAGIQGPIGKFSVNRTDEWVNTINVNLIGTIYMIKELLPKMARDSSIINFSGGGALTPRENFSAYAVAKTGVVRLTEILAKEFGGRSIRVNAVSPGGINTFMFKEMLSAGKKKVGTKEWKKLMLQKKNGGEDPTKVAHLCLWLASEKSKPLSGKTVSAVYDDWQKWSKQKIAKINQSDWYALRRFDPFTLNKLPKL